MHDQLAQLVETSRRPNVTVQVPPTGGDFNPRAQWCLELAKLHTAPAHVAATAQASDSREWVMIAGPWFSDTSLALHEQG